jgi:predicted amidohydrolase
MKSYYSAGDSIAIYNSKFGKFGILICYDIENQAPLMETLV